MVNNALRIHTTKKDSRILAVPNVKDENMLIIYIAIPVGVVRIIEPPKRQGR